MKKPCTFEMVKRAMEEALADHMRDGAADYAAQAKASRVGDRIEIQIPIDEETYRRLVGDGVSGSWMDEWQRGEPDLDDESVEWLRTRPGAVQQLMLRFPPSCIVRAVDGKQLLCPAPGTHGIVTSYSEPSEEKPKGLVSVRDGPYGSVRHQCLPEWLEVVGYWKGLTPERLKKILEVKP